MSSRMTGKEKTAREAAESARATHRWVRLAIQIVFFILAPGVFSGAFNGVKYLFGQIGAVQGLEFTSFVVLLVATLGFTVLFGRFFCGYACAFGTLGDVLYQVFEFLRSKTPIPRLRFPDGLVRVLSCVKYVVLACVCIACTAGAWSAVSGYSPWVAFASFTTLSFENVSPVAFALLALVAVGMIVRERFFCQFLCPMGALFSLMPVLGFSEFTRTRSHCARSCGKCKDGCPASIWPDADSLAHCECFSCGRCAVACPLSNVNLVAIERADAKEERLRKEAARRQKAAASVAAASATTASAAAASADAAAEVPGQVAAQTATAASVAVHANSRAAEPRPLRKTRQTWRLLRGSETWLVVAKAVALLALCWAVGATCYLPAFASVFPLAG